MTLEELPVLQERRALCPWGSQGNRNQSSEATGEVSTLLLGFQNGGPDYRVALAQEDLAPGSPAATRDLGWSWPFLSLTFYLPLYKPQKPQWGCLLTDSPCCHSRSSETVRFMGLDMVRMTV